MRFVALFLIIPLAGCASMAAPAPSAQPLGSCSVQARPRVELFGEFERPGVIPYTPGLTVYGAIQQGGGLKLEARGDKLRILRCGRALGPFAAPETPGAQTDLPLEPGDVLDSLYYDML